MKFIVRFVMALFFFINVLVLLGMAISGAGDLLRGHTMTDRLFGAAFLIIGVLFSAILIKQGKRYISSCGGKYLAAWWKEHRGLAISSLALTVVLVLFRQQFFTTVVYGGFTLGNLVLNQARFAYQSFFSFDLFDYGFGMLAWVGQLYYIYLVLGLVETRWKKHSEKR